MSCARTCELLFGGWLATSPLWFDSAGWPDLSPGVLVATLAVVSLTRQESRAHLWELGPTAVLLFGLATRGFQPTAASQNKIVIGLLIASFAIVPTRAFTPPPAWNSEGRDARRRPSTGSRCSESLQPNCRSRESPHMGTEDGTGLEGKVRASW